MAAKRKNVQDVAAGGKWRNRIVGSGIEDADQLLANPRNWRIHPGEQQRALGSVLERVGWVQNVVVNQRTGFVVDGHLRVAMAISAAEKVPVLYVDLAEEEEALVLSTFDPVSAMAVRDQELFNSLLADVRGSETGQNLGADLDKLLADLELGDGESPTAVSGPVEGEDEAPEPPEAPVSVVGDLWLLGDHRVLCGDSTSIDATSRLFGATKPELVFTDPPYGISVVKPVGDSGDKGRLAHGGRLRFDKKGRGDDAIMKGKLYAPIMNDGGTETAQEFYHAALSAGVERFVIFGGNYFTDFLPPSPCWVVWDKQNGESSFADVEMAWTSFDKGAKLYRFMWHGLARQGDRKTELAGRVHPTQKPVGMIEQVFQDFPAKTVYDGFLGSGSTLIACEKTGRQCFGMELSPDYVDVIVQRWQEFTGKKAILDGTGAIFEHVKFGRRLGAQDAIKEEVVCS